eukprot:6494604-Alexandrium_andersonii.AAC.1
MFQQAHDGVRKAIQALRDKREGVPQHASVDLIAELIQGSDSHEDMPVVQECIQHPPDVPNCY